MEIFARLMVLRLSLVFESTYGDGTAILGSEIEPFCIAVTKKHFPEY